MKDERRARNKIGVTQYVDTSCICFFRMILCLALATTSCVKYLPHPAQEKPCYDPAHPEVMRQYDCEVFARIKKRWLWLIDHYTIPGQRSGVVVVVGNCYPDGTIDNVYVKEDSAGQILALYAIKAIEDCAPFDPWPEDLKLCVPRGYRELKITFYY